MREFLSSAIEVLLTRQVAPDEWEALVRPGKKIRVGERIDFGDGELTAEVLSRGEYGLRRIRLTAKGEVPERSSGSATFRCHLTFRARTNIADRERYQTIFADHPGAVAAPTAGLHFSPAILERLRQRSIETVSITLDVGLGTFQPIHEEEIEQHKIHSERYEISDAAGSCHLPRAPRRPAHPGCGNNGGARA